MKKIRIFLEHLERLLGIGTAGFWGLGILIFIFDPKQSAADDQARNIAMSIAAASFGVFLICHANRCRRLRNKSEVYRMCLADQPEAMIHDIAHRLNIPTEQVMTELKKLIDKDYLENVYIDTAEGRVKMLSGKENNMKTDNRYVNVSCPKCGAVCSVVKNAQQWVCTYCSNPIDKEQH